MEASPNVQAMEQNRELAINAARDVIRQNYSPSWGVTDHAKALIQDLNNQRSLAEVRSHVLARQGAGGAETSKEAMARQQRAYLDATCARASAYQAPVASVKRGFNVLKEKSEKVIGAVGSVAQGRSSEAPIQSTEAQVPRVTSPMNYAAAPSFVSRRSASYTPGAMISSQPASRSYPATPVAQTSVASLPDSPRVSQSVSSIRMDDGSRVTFSQAAGAAGLKGPQQAGVSQVADSTFGRRAPIVIDGASVGNSGNGLAQVQSGSLRRGTSPGNLDLGMKSEGTMFGDMDGTDHASRNTRTYAAGQTPK